MKSTEEIQAWVAHILEDLRPWPDGAVSIRARLEPKPREASTAVIASIHTEHAEDLGEVGAKVARAVWLLDPATLPDTLDMRIEFLDGSGKAIPGGRTMRLQNVRPAVAAVEPGRRPPVPVATVAQPPVLDVEQLPSGPPLMARVQQASAQMTAGLPDQVDRGSVVLLHNTHMYYAALLTELVRGVHHEARMMSAENRLLTGEVRENTGALRAIVEGRDETNSDLIALTIKSKADAAAADAQAELAHRVGLDEGRAEGRAEAPGAAPKPSKLMEGMQIVKEAASTIGQARAAMAEAATLQAKAEAMTGAAPPTTAEGLLQALLALPKDELIGALGTLPPEVRSVVGALLGGGA